MLKEAERQYSNELQRDLQNSCESRGCRLNHEVKKLKVLFRNCLVTAVSSSACTLAGSFHSLFYWEVCVSGSDLTPLFCSSLRNHISVTLESCKSTTAHGNPNKHTKPARHPSNLPGVEDIRSINKTGLMSSDSSPCELQAIFHKLEHCSDQNYCTQH